MRITGPPLVCFEGTGKRTVTGPTSTAGIFAAYPFLTTEGQVVSLISLFMSPDRR